MNKIIIYPDSNLNGLIYNEWKNKINEKFEQDVYKLFIINLPLQQI